MKKGIISVSLVTFALLQIWLINIIFSYPIIGISVTHQNDKWVISHFETKHTAREAGIEIGDIILQINGQNPSDYIPVKKWRSIDRYDELLVERDGVQFVITAPKVPFEISYNITPLIIGTISFFMALFIYRNTNNSKSALVLSIVFLNIGLVFTGLGASLRGDAIGKFFVSAGVVSVPILFLHFLVSLIEEKGGFLAFYNKYIKYLYIPVVIALFLLMTMFIPLELTYYTYSFAVKATLFFFFIGIVLNVACLVHLYAKYRKQVGYLTTLVKMVWYSLMISFVPLLSFAILPKLFIGYELIDSLYLSWFILFFPLSFAYLILTKQLYNIDNILRRFLVTTIVAIIPSAVITGLFSLFYEGENEGRLLVLLFLFIVIIQSFLLYSLEYFMTILQAALFPRKHLLQMSIRKIAKNLTTISSFNELKTIILVDIVKTLDVFGGAIVFCYKNTMETIHEGDIDINKVEAFIASGEEQHPEFSCLKINSHEDYTSYLIMGQTRSNTLLGVEELQWLNIIISYLAVSLENLHLIRKMNLKLQQLVAQMPNENEANDFIWFRKLTFELQEKERIRIATDLHDTTMQDLFFLKQRLTNVLKRYSMTKEDLNHMNSLIEYIEIININLRQNCFELHPHLLREIGLVQTLRKIVERESFNADFEIELITEHDSYIEKRDMETKRHLFRMVQELLNNAKKHSKASKVIMKLLASPDGLQLIYEDNGVGFDADRAVPNHVGSSGIGMEQMKSRVLHLNGSWDLKTSKGAGVYIRIVLPSFESITA